MPKNRTIKKSYQITLQERVKIFSAMIESNCVPWLNCYQTLSRHFDIPLFFLEAPFTWLTLKELWEYFEDICIKLKKQLHRTTGAFFVVLKLFASVSGMRLKTDPIDILGEPDACVVKFTIVSIFKSNLKDKTHNKTFLHQIIFCFARFLKILSAFS